MSDGTVIQRTESWRTRLLIVAVLDAGWLSLLFPPFPTSFSGWFVVIVAGLFLIAYGYGSLRAALWLHTSGLKKSIVNALIVIVAVAVLIAIIVVAYLCSAFIRGDLPFVH